MKTARLRLGLLGAGRLGAFYARVLQSLQGCRLAAIADPKQDRAERVAGAYAVPTSYRDPLKLIASEDLDAIVVASPTKTHSELVSAAADRGLAIFCEKPLALTLDEARAMKHKIEQAGVFFHMGLMRRFDPGYAEAKKQIQAGAIGTPVLFRSSSRDPFLPSLDYVDPKKSGGLFVDMGIHDFDLSLWLLGPVKSVYSLGGTLVYPELNELGDIDNAIVSLHFAGGQLGSIDLSRNGIYGYDIFSEILGTEGTLRIGYLRETPLKILNRSGVHHDVVPYFFERFEKAYIRQLHNFVEHLAQDRPPAITLEEGIEALRVSLAARHSFERKELIAVESIQ